MKTHIFYLLAILLATLGTPRAEVTCPSASSSAELFWYVDFQGVCRDTRTAVLDGLATHKVVPNQYFESTVPFTGFEPSITLDLFVDNFAGSGIAVINTHGGPDGGVALEWWYTRSEAEDKIAEYDSIYDATGGAEGFDASHLEVGSVPSGMGDITKGIILNPDGIIAHVRGTNDPKSLVCGLFSHSHITRGNFLHPDGKSTFVGVTDEGSIYQIMCDQGTDIMFPRFGCDGVPKIGYSLPEAMWGNISMFLFQADDVHPEVRAWGGSGTECTEAYYNTVVGCEWTVRCDGCMNNDALFLRLGAFGTTVWCIANHRDTQSIEIVGLPSADAIAPDGQIVRQITLMPNDGSYAYIEQGVDTQAFPFFALIETDIFGHTTWTDPFPLTEQPEDWQDILNYNSTPHDPVPPPVEPPGNSREFWLTENGEVTFTKPAFKASLSEHMTSGNPYDPAHVGLYGTDAYLVVEEALTLQGLGYDAFRMFEGDGTVSDQRAWAESLYTENGLYRQWCQVMETCDADEYPSHPVYGIVGLRSNTQPNHIRYSVFPNDTGSCGSNTSCMDLSDGADWLSDELEDLPMYSVPTNSWADVVNLRYSAFRYDTDVNPRQRAVFLVGDYINKNSGGIDHGFERSMQNMRTYYASRGVPVYEMRDSQTTSAEVEATINAGCVAIIGTGGLLLPGTWPALRMIATGVGGPAPPWEQVFTTPQSMIALLPSCFTGAESISWTPQISGLFADTTVSTLAFVAGNVQAGRDLHHKLWMEELGAAVNDADVGTSWPRIVWDAKRRAVTQYEFLDQYLRTTTSLGTMVTKPAVPSITDVGDNPPGIHDAVFAIRSIANVVPHPVLEYRLPAGDHITLAIYDARGRLITTMESAQKDRGSHRVTWNGRDRSGRHVSAGVYFARLFARSHGTTVTKIVVAR